MSDLVRLRTDWEPRILSIVRIVAVLLFLEHGMAMLFGFPTAAMHPQMFQLVWFAGIIELLGGLLLALGLFTRAVALIMSGEMALAYFLSHAPRSFFPLLNQGDAAIHLFVAGGGRWSLDRMRSQ